MRVTGANNPNLAAVAITAMMKRALYLIDAGEGFGARIEWQAPGMCGPEAMTLDENREWQRVRESNSRGGEANRASNAAP